MLEALQFLLLIEDAVISWVELFFKDQAWQ
jgi:hypothetical protein